MTHPKRPWTEYEVSELKRMLRLNCTAAEIGAALGRTESSVYHRTVYEQAQSDQCMRGAHALRNATGLKVQPYYHRDIVSRLCGDPSPDRSALAQRGGAI